MVSFLTDKSQLLSSKPLQLGRTAEPCTVIFGPSNFDVGNEWRSIKLNCPEMATFKDFDTDSQIHPFVKHYGDDTFITVKINAEKAENLRYGDALVIIVSPRRWKMSGKQGISLHCEAIKVVERKKEIFEFID